MGPFPLQILYDSIYIQNLQTGYDRHKLFGDFKYLFLFAQVVGDKLTAGGQGWHLGGSQQAGEMGLQELPDVRQEHMLSPAIGME